MNQNPTPEHPALEPDLTPVWIILKAWATHHGVGLPSASRLARLRRLTPLARLPSGAYLAQLQTAPCSAPAEVEELDWTRLEVCEFDRPHLEQAAEQLQQEVVLSGSAVYTPLKGEAALLEAFAEQRSHTWEAKAKAQRERSLGFLKLSRDLLEQAKDSFSDQEWTVLSLRYALGGVKRVHSLEEVAQHIGRTRERVQALERKALHRPAKSVQAGP